MRSVHSTPNVLFQGTKPGLALKFKTHNAVWQRDLLFAMSCIGICA